MAKEELDFSEIAEFTEGNTEVFSAEEAPEKGDEKKQPGNEVEFVEGGEYEETSDPSTEEKEKDEDVQGKEKSTDAQEENAPSPTDTDDPEDASDSFALTYARFQKEEGLLPDFDEEEFSDLVKEKGETEGMKYLAQKQYDYAAEEARRMYAEDKEELEEYFKLKDLGVDADKAKELAYSKAKFEGIDENALEEDEELQKSILTQFYKYTTRYSDKKIAKEIEKSFTLGENAEEAKEALETVKEYTKEQIKAEENSIKERDRQETEKVKKYTEDMKNLIYSTSEILEGQKINKQTQKKLEDMILKPAAKTDQGVPVNAIWAERIKNPQKFDLTLAYLINTGIFEGKLDKVKTKEKTKVITDFEKALRKKGGTNPGRANLDAGRDGMDNMELAKQLNLM